MKTCLGAFFFGFVLFRLGGLAPAHAEVLAVVGMPIVQARSSIEISHNVKVDSNQKLTNRLVISVEEGRYVWQTRDRIPLEFKKMEGYDLFTEPVSGGYIKVVKQSDGRYVYLEHISGQDLKVFNYWGLISVYEP